VGVVCLREGQVLLIRRSKPPLAGGWSLPGGRLEWGERAAAAALRELAEETGVQAQILGLVDVVDGFFPAEAPGGADHHYVLIDYAARWVAGEPRAGDDAVEAAFHPLAALAGLDLWPETLRVIRDAAARYGA
jgi:8-oxo-dGTP diphosphatase